MVYADLLRVANCVRSGEHGWAAPRQKGGGPDRMVAILEDVAAEHGLDIETFVDDGTLSTIGTVITRLRDPALGPEWTLYHYRGLAEVELGSWR